MATHTPAAIKKIESVNPATGEVLQQFCVAPESEVREAVRRARESQMGWAQIGIKKRVSILREFQKLLFNHKTDVAQLITKEVGKPVVEALLTEVVVVLDAAQFCIDNAYSLLREETVPHRNPAMKTKSGQLVREPYGVVGIISPWNYPFSIPATETLAALITGNAVVLKPSELTSLCALRLVELFHQAGVPTKVLQVVLGDGSTGAALVNADISKLVFTGSVATGKRIAEAAASRLLPVVLELGGKDPMIVLDDADLEVASSGAVWGAFMNAGQTCLSVERCYVHRSSYEEFLELVTRKTKMMRVGGGEDDRADIGPLINERQLRIVEAQVDEALARGARLLAGGTRLRQVGPNFYSPTILCDVSHEMLIMREETFGPVLPVMAFDNDDEAIRLANDSEYGLAASVWTKDRARGERVARRIEAGTVMVNDVISCFGISEAPHGGVKASGIGRTHGRHGLEEMTRLKYLDSDRFPGLKKIWWFGYGGSFREQMEGFVDSLFSRSLARRLPGLIRAAGALVRKGQI